MSWFFLKCLKNKTKREKLVGSESILTFEAVMFNRYEDLDSKSRAFATNTLQR